MSRIIVFPRYGVLGASSRLRMYQYEPFFDSSGYDLKFLPLLSDGYLQRLYNGRKSFFLILKEYIKRFFQLLFIPSHEAVWLEKELFPWAPFWLERLLLFRAKKLIVEYDDAIFHNYDLHKNKLLRKLWGKKISRLMARADSVIVGSKYLYEYAVQTGCKNVQLVPTVVDIERYSVAPETDKSGQLILGWIGSPSTAHYLSILDEPLKSIKEHVDIKAVAIGARTDQLHESLFDAVRWSEESESSLLCELDIGVMPLHDSPWEQGKCGYKIVQYMAAGLPVVVSDIGANKDIVIQGETGFLVSNTREWIDAILLIAKDDALRATMSEKARFRAEQIYSVQVQNKKLLEVFENIKNESNA